MSDSDGLVHAYVVDPQGKGTRLEWEQVRTWSSDQGLLWLHLDCLNPDAQTWLAQESGLGEVLAEAMMEEESRPRVTSADNGFLLILRGVNCNPGADPEDMVALRMWVDEHRIITIRRRRLMAIEDMCQSIESGKGPVCTSDFLGMVSGNMVDRMGDVISDIDDEVDELEDSVLTEESYELRPKLAGIRRQVIGLRRYISPQRDVMARLQNERVSWIREIDRVRIREVAERTARFVEDLDSARDRAAITQEELNSRLAETMNKTMYVLSIVAAIFLPLGLLTGLLGINVGGIPGTESPWAFATVCIFLVGVAIVQFWTFRRMRWV